jgi:Tfp pilus assembly protein PilX
MGLVAGRHTIEGRRGGLCSPGSNQGNALILAVLILMVLSSVGAISIQLTNTDLAASGNLVAASQAHAAGEAGMLHGVARLGNRPISYLEQMVYKLVEFNTNTTDITKHIPVVEGGSSVARLRQEMAYEAESRWLIEIKGAVGTGANENICHHLYEVEARGAIPTKQNQTMQQIIDEMGTVVVRNRARVLTGPAPCVLR